MEKIQRRLISGLALACFLLLIVVGFLVSSRLREQREMAARMEAIMVADQQRGQAAAAPAPPPAPVGLSPVGRWNWSDQWIYELRPDGNMYYYLYTNPQMFKSGSWRIQSMGGRSWVWIGFGDADHTWQNFDMVDNNTMVMSDARGGQPFRRIQ